LFLVKSHFSAASSGVPKNLESESRRHGILGGAALFCGMITRLDKRFAMLYGVFKALVGIFSIYAISSGVFSCALCSIDVVIVNGRIEHPPGKGLVRVQLVYPNQKMGESGEVTVDGESFRIQIPFLTQSRASVLIGSLLEKCDRKPKTVVVTLIEADQEYDRVFLDLAKDFKTADRSAYALRSEILLHGPPSTPSIR
jgi:hypothetical protein